MRFRTASGTFGRTPSTLAGCAGSSAGPSARTMPIFSCGRGAAPSPGSVPPAAEQSTPTGRSLPQASRRQAVWEELRSLPTSSLPHPALRLAGESGLHGQARTVSGVTRGAPAAPGPGRIGGGPGAAPDRRESHTVPRMPRGPAAPFDWAHGRCRGRLPAGPPPGPGYLMSPPSVCHPPIAPTPRRPRRDGSLWPPRVATGPPEAWGAPAGPRTTPRSRRPPLVVGSKALPSAPGFRYNPHSW